jgi:ABC-type Mn2+/Zn2+ transport system ATPase subunit
MPGLKIKSIKASGFLSFENIELGNLNENINFIVGPNGAGKTNFTKLMGFIKMAISKPYNFPHSVEIQNYLKKDYHQIKLDVDTEIILSDKEIEYVSMVTAMLFFNNIISSNPNNYYLSLKNVITFFEFFWKEKFKKGKLILEYDDVSKNSKIFYKFTNEETIVLDIANNLLITGYNEEYYEENKNHFSSKTDDEKIFLMLQIFDNDIGVWSQQDVKYPLLSENLNQFGKHNNLKEESDKISKTVKFLENSLIKYDQSSFPVGTNQVSISTIFMWIFENSIVTLDNFRCPSKNILSIKEINGMQNFDSNNLYSYLLQLKINKIDDYNEVKETFKKLSNGKGFDVRVAEIKEFSNDANIFPLPMPKPQTWDAQINQNINRVDVSIIDHKLELQLYFKDNPDSEEYPFEFSPAGYYEILTLSAIIAGINNKVIILDEPAQNLYPTLQHKLLLEIDKYSKDNKNQFFIITHSPDLVKIDEKSNIFIFKQKNNVTFINKFEPNELSQINFFKYEELKRLFFVKGVILVEGFSEEILMNRLIRNPVFFENAIKNASNKEDSENTVSLGDIEIVNIEGVNSLMNFICLTYRLNLPYIAMIDDDIFDPESEIFKKNKGSNAENITKRLGLNYKDNLENSFTEVIEKIKNDYHAYFAHPNFEGYVDEYFKYYENFKENYLNWCKEKFGSGERECSEHKKLIIHYI